MFPTYLLDSTVEFAALFLWAEAHNKPVEHRYIRARRHAFKRPDRWTPWDDEQIPAKQFYQLFRMTL
ncbi:uncharacterized protein VP01_2615g1, partial [Puccinia sorghi]